jgi:hypothetical protein
VCAHLKGRGRVKVFHHIHVIVHHRELVRRVHAEALGHARVPVVVQSGGNDEAEDLLRAHVPRHVDRRHEKVHGLFESALNQWTWNIGVETGDFKGFLQTW